MDKPTGFLESECGRVIAARGGASADQNVVPISEPLRARATLRERERRFRELLDALPAAIYTTDAAGRLTYYNDAAGERPDGTRVPFIPYPTPLHDESGKLIGAVNMLVDITERKRAEEQQALLVRELHHR